MRTSTDAPRTVTVLAILLAGLIAALALLAMLPVIAHAEACPNEQFRTGPSANLPDCRAYEQVSPVEKNGGFINTGTFISSPEGESVGFTSNSGFAGATSDIYASTPYLSTRGAGGWSTVAQTQSEAQFINFHILTGEDFLDYSFGNDETSLEAGVKLYMSREVGHPEADLDFYLMGPDGVNHEVGPVVPPSASGLALKGIAEGQKYEYVGLPADGSHVVFRDPEAVAANQWSFGNPGALLEYAGTNNSTPMLVVPDPATEDNNCPGQLLGGVPVFFNGFHNPISSNGSKVFFTDECRGELFVRVDNGESDAHTVAISEPSMEDCSQCESIVPPLISESGAPQAEFLSASEDGSKVFFYTSQPLLGDSGGLYEYDSDAPEGERVSLVAPGFIPSLVPNLSPNIRVHVSQDGSHVYFLSRRVLTGEPSADAQGLSAAGVAVSGGAVAQVGERNLYVFERDAHYPAGHIAFIAMLGETDFESGHNLQADVTPDGRFLVLGVHSDLTADDTTSAEQIFEYDAQTGSLVRISIGENGYNNNGNVTSNAQIVDEDGVTEKGFLPSFYSDHLSVSEDGAFVFFTSEAALTPHALNVVGPAENVYEYHAGRVYLISDGQDTSTHDEVNSQVHLLSTDLSGRDVFFETTDSLVPQDTDTNKDIYDARIDGGFPAPETAAACTDDACQGGLSGAPVLLSPGSAFQAGGDNLAPPTAAKPTAKSKAKPKAKKKQRRTKAKKRKRTGKKADRAKRSSKHSERGGRR